MKILAAADLHLHEWPGLAPVDRLADQENVLAQISQLAVERDVDLVLIAGDVFHQPIPTPAVELVFQRFLRSLGRIPVIAATGNASHDIENAERPCALELYESPTFRCSRRPEYITEFAGVTVATLPSVPVSNYVALVGGGDRDEVNQNVADHLIQIAGDLAAECRFTGLPSVLVAHWSVSGAAFPNGLPVDAAREPVLPLSALELLDFDAIVLGHVHREQRLASDRQEPQMPIFYCGSPMPMDFGEAGYEHGVFILEIGAKGYPLVDEFVPLESRAFATLAYDLGVPDHEAALASPQEVDWVVPPDAIVRVHIKATPDQWRRVDTRAIRSALADAGAAFVKFDPDIVRADRARVEGLTEELGELDAVRMWNQAQNVEPEHAEQLLELTQAYLEEVRS